MYINEGGSRSELVWMVTCMAL